MSKITPNKKLFLKKLALWFVVAFLIQALVFLYLSKSFTASNKDKATTVIKASTKIKDKVTYNFNSEGAVKEYSVSYDAKYIAFIDDKALKIFNTKDKDIIYDGFKDQEKPHEALSNKEINYPDDTTFRVIQPKWLPDRNKLIYVLIWQEKGMGLINIDVYISNLDGSNKLRISQFKNQPQGTNVKNIVLSTKTSLIYLQIEKPDGLSSLYQIDYMWQTKQLPGSGDVIGNIAVNSQDGLLFAEIYKKNNPDISFIKDNSINHLFAEGEKYRLLGLSDEGKLYLGEIVDKTIKSINYAPLQNQTKESYQLEPDPATGKKVLKQKAEAEIEAGDINKVMDLNEGVSPECIYIHQDGDLILDNSQKNNQVFLYHDGKEKKKVNISPGKTEILLNKKYIAVLKKSNNVNSNQIEVYNLDI